ncbi:phosphodiesterase [Pseudoxanthomonas gei]|uniref:Phosphodiesterase n=1 Tax=Pseudoxanthomonas gei TaxID=1383030 RepID=A0ABX0A9I1_9GAMM|nr:alkaline phosphatase D family protein [Pseudoxanthomonas gei]NDK38177.1 phosphodiesterase [Pseudoxanthomonas gei]
MSTLKRRQFLGLAAALGATLAWGCAAVRPSASGWRERRDLFPQGVASGDPDTDSVLLWTRRPYADGRESAMLTVEVAEDAAFTRVIATTSAKVQAASDWTCRVLVGHLLPAREYWYRFVDEEGNGSRIGRTLTAPARDDPRPARFAFVSCQSIPEGYLNAYRRMIWEDERAAPAERIGFVLHLGDFVYEVVQYPEQVKDGKRYDRAITFPIRFPKGKTVARNRFWVPDSLEDYRTLYHAYLQDPDLQDARARWPFVCIWDNHEFSWNGWQSIQEFAGTEGWVPAQTLKVAANQAWFEYQPARVLPPGAKLDSFDAPDVVDTKITGFDDDGLGTEANNLAAINSLIAYRTLRWGRHIDLLITDNRSFRSRDPGNHDEINPLFEGDTLGFVPEELWAQLDAGRDYANGHPPAKLTMGDRSVDNYVAGAAPQTMLGAKQKAWFLERLRSATATWKIWGNSLGALDQRVDPQNLPPEMGRWKGAGYGLLATYDWGGMYHERAEIFDAVRDAGITGFAIVSGDRHSFWAGYAAAALPPAAFEPVGVSFVGGSLISPGMAEANEYNQNKENNPTRPLYIAEINGGPPQCTANLMLHHGVRSALEYAGSGDLAKAHAVRNPDLAPHLEFVDMGGHGYATVRVDADAMVTEFVCIPRPITRSATDDGGSLRYRVRFEVPLWQAGERPRMRKTVVEGDAGLAV